MPSNTSKSTPKKASHPANKDYEALGKAVANFYEQGYLDPKTSIRMSFLKGIAGGFGGVIGATIVVALLLWVLSFFNEVPLIGNFVDSVERTLNGY